MITVVIYREKAKDMDRMFWNMCGVLGDTLGSLKCNYGRHTIDLNDVKIFFYFGDAACKLAGMRIDVLNTDSYEAEAFLESRMSDDSMKVVIPRYFSDDRVCEIVTRLVIGIGNGIKEVKNDQSD